MVSTTMPMVLLVLRSARVASRPLPSGSRRSMMTTSGWSAPAWRIASAAVAASPTTSNCRSRSNACRSPRRISFTGDPQVLGARVLSGVGDGFLRDPEQFRLGRGRQPGGGLVERQVHPQPGRGPDGTRIISYRRTDAAVTVNFAAELEKRQ